MWKVGTPIIAAVNGWAMGAGFWYQLAADITIASDKAVFAQPEVRHISATSFLFTALCGWKAANRWGLTGDHFDAQEALRIGMINEVVPHDQLMDHARALAKRIALVPEPAVRLNKAIAMQGIQAAGLHAALLLEGTLGTLAHASHNEFRQQLFDVHAKEGVKAYLQMRDGPFQPEPMGPRSAKGRAQRARTLPPVLSNANFRLVGRAPPRRSARLCGYCAAWATAMLFRCASTSSMCMTSTYLCARSNRFVLSGMSARSNTHSSTTETWNPADWASTTPARRHPDAVPPPTTRLRMPSVFSCDSSGVPLKQLARVLWMITSPGSGASAGKMS